MTELNPAPRRPLPLWLVLAGATAVGWLVWVLAPRLLVTFGVFNYGTWFIDSHAILATNDALKLGLDPSKPNPLDALGRPHSYSQWWFVLGWLGLTRDDNFLVGGVCVALFFAAALATLRARDARDVAVALLCLLSPPVMMAVNRANNDLVVFALTGFAALLVTRARWRPALSGVALLAVATGLKFYPVVSGFALLGLRPLRRMWPLALTAGIFCAAAFVHVWDYFRQAVIPVPANVHTFGAPLLWRDFGFEGAWVAPASVLVLAALAAPLWWWRSRAAAASAPVDSDEIQAHAAAVMLLACFVGGISFSYRGILAIWPLWLAWREWRGGGPCRGLLRAETLLLAGVMWLDGLFCTAVNLTHTAVARPVLEHWQLVWRYCTQPLVWLAMAFLTARLLGVLAKLWRDWRATPPGAPAGLSSNR
jgi:hypothetical protein